MKNKKVVSAILTGALAISALFGLTACGDIEPPHNHVYSAHTFYGIKEEDLTKKVYSFKVCDCGKRIDETLVENAIIANVDNCEAIVRGSANPDYELTNKVVVFEKGIYPNSIAGGTKNYHNTIFAGEYTGKTKEVVFDAGSYLYTQGAYSIDSLEYNNIVFKDRLFLGSQQNDIKNIKINNCSFVNEDVDKGANPAILIAPKEDQHVTSENVVIENCYIDGWYQGILVYQNKNFIAKNNVIKNTIHNAIALQLNSGYTKKVTGNIVISDNEISNIIGVSNTGERAIRFNHLENATVTISNNKFKNAFDKNNEVVKASSITESTILFKDNTNDGQKILDDLIEEDQTDPAITI